MCSLTSAIPDIPPPTPSLLPRHPQVLSQTQDHRQRVLVAAAKNIRIWFIKVRKIKAIYHTLNLFNLDVTQKCLIAECWLPVDDYSAVQLALGRGSERAGSSIRPVLNKLTTREAPPTFNRTNKFTNGFQTLVDAYGVANYREMNPGEGRLGALRGVGGMAGVRAWLFVCTGGSAKNIRCWCPICQLSFVKGVSCKHAN